MTQVTQCCKSAILQQKLIKNKYNKMLKLRKYKTKYDTDELIYDMETDSQTRRTDSLPRGGGGGGVD